MVRKVLLQNGDDFILPSQVMIAPSLPESQRSRERPAPPSNSSFGPISIIY